MSEHQPPSGAPEYLESGSGEPLRAEPTPPDSTPTSAGRRGRRRAWWIGGGAVVLLGAGAGAWAALGFFQQGAQPAVALPSSTVAYLSIDLDPSGGQKIDAFRMLNKFPAFKEQVHIGSVDELRHKIGDELVSQSHCQGLDYDQDIDPWLGDRAAVALVDLPGADPDAVVVVQVKDEGKAREGLKTLDGCATDTTGDSTGYVVQNGWAVLADTQDYAEKVADAAARSNLADDATYQRWTKAVGEAGVLNGYAAPTAGRYLGDKFGSLSHMFGSEGSASSSSSPAISVDPFTEALSKFHGGAATLRFTGDGVEFAAVGDGTVGDLSEVTGNVGGTLVQRLPGDTAAAAGITFPEGWVERQLDRLSGVSGGGMSREDFARELSQDTGLAVPGDIETLLGSGVSLSVGKDFDLEAATNSGDGSGIPIALTVKGDPRAIDAVLDKLRGRLGDTALLGSDSAGDLEVIGPSEAYRKQVLAGGSLGDDGTFHGVVPAAGDAAGVLFANVDDFESQIEKASAGDQKTIDNVRPLRAIGSSWWNDDGVVRLSFKITTD
jgi:Protein of unknown function (DUF3352)